MLANVFVLSQEYNSKQYNLVFDTSCSTADVNQVLLQMIHSIKKIEDDARSKSEQQPSESPPQVKEEQQNDEPAV